MDILSEATDITFNSDANPFYGLSGVFSVSPPGEIVWSAALTVEEDIDGADTYLGFEPFSSQGSLDPFAFSYDGNNISVSYLVYQIGEDLAVEVSGHSHLGSGSFNLYLDGSAFLIEDPASDSNGRFEFSNHSLSWTNGQIVRVWLTENQEPTLTISGTALVGQTLTAVIDEPDGLLADDQITYQWIRVDGMTETDISGATDSTYTLVDDDEDKTIKVEVSYTDNANFAESLTSEPTATVTSGPGVESVSVGSITRNSATVTVTINNPDSTSQTVYLQYKKISPAPGRAEGPSPTTSTSVEFDLTGLEGNQDYDVQASLDSNFASGVVAKGFKTSPFEPGKPLITSNSILAGDGTLRFTWIKAPDNGSVILDYTVQWKGPGQNYDPSRQATQTGHVYTITGLTNGDEYTARVRARNAVGSGEWSDEVEGTPSTTPDAPNGAGRAGQRAVDGELGRARHRRQRHHRVHGAVEGQHRHRLAIGQRHRGDAHRVASGHVAHLHRADQRHRLHGAGAGHQRQRRRRLVRGRDGHPGVPAPAWRRSHSPK